MEVGGKVVAEEYSGEGGSVTQKEVESQNGDNVDADPGKADVEDNAEADAGSDIDADIEEAVQDNVEKYGVDVDADIYEDYDVDDYDSSDEYQVV